MLEIPLTAGVAAGSVLVIFAPVIAAISAMAALVAKFRIEIIRNKTIKKRKTAGKKRK